jgi:hypothetical protein
VSHDAEKVEIVAKAISGQQHCSCGVESHRSDWLRSMGRKVTDEPFTFIVILYNNLQ